MSNKCNHDICKYAGFNIYWLVRHNSYNIADMFKTCNYFKNLLRSIKILRMKIYNSPDIYFFDIKDLKLKLTAKYYCYKIYIYNSMKIIAGSFNEFLSP